MLKKIAKLALVSFAALGLAMPAMADDAKWTWSGWTNWTLTNETTKSGTTSPYTILDMATDGDLGFSVSKTDGDWSAEVTWNHFADGAGVIWVDDEGDSDADGSDDLEKLDEGAGSITLTKAGSYTLKFGANSELGLSGDGDKGEEIDPGVRVVATAADTTDAGAFGTSAKSQGERTSVIFSPVIGDGMGLSIQLGLNDAKGDLSTTDIGLLFNMTMDTLDIKANYGQTTWAADEVQESAKVATGDDGKTASDLAAKVTATAGNMKVGGGFGTSSEKEGNTPTEYSDVVIFGFLDMTVNTELSVGVRISTKAATSKSGTVESKEDDTGFDLSVKFDLGDNMVLTGKYASRTDKKTVGGETTCVVYTGCQDFTTSGLHVSVTKTIGSAAIKGMYMTKTHKDALTAGTTDKTVDTIQGKVTFTF